MAGDARMIDVRTTLDCLDCQRPLPGALNVSTTTGAGIAWLCEACAVRYPNPDAVRARVVEASTRRLGEWPGALGKDAP